LAKNGSPIDKDLPFMHWEFSFDKSFSFKSIVEAVINPKVRKRWDKDLKNVRIGSQICKNSNIIYTEYQDYNLIGKSDSADKQLCFSTENENDQPIFVCYTSYIPEKLVKKQFGTTRIEIIF
jgi:hypothetical protein